MDYLWPKKDLGIRYLDDLFCHFDIINEPNYGNGYIDKSGSLIEFMGQFDILNDKPVPSEFFSVEPSIPKSLVVNKINLKFDLILLDPAVSFCNDQTCLISSSNGCEHVEDQGQIFTSVRRKKCKSKLHVQDNFEIPIFNNFVCLSSSLDVDLSFDNLDDVNDVPVQSNNSRECCSVSDNCGGFNTLDCSFSSVSLMDGSDDIGDVVFELMDQDSVVLGNNSFGDQMIFRIKVL